jgi:exoribonuclease-2
MFQGTPESIYAKTATEVAEEKAARKAKAEEQQAWIDFLERLKDGQYLEQDERFLEEVAALARGERENSRVMKALGQMETPENAHALLLEVGYWDITYNPYPARLGLTTSEPDSEIPPLEDEPRRDLTHLYSLAIDDAGTEDPDDAIGLEGNRLWVHIADVAGLVTPGSPADIEAMSRGSNIYLPEGTVNMLPPVATTKLGLGLAEISPALSFGIDLGPDGTTAGLEITPSWIRVTRLTYDEVEVRLAESPFRELDQLAQYYEARRMEKGSIQINLPEVKVSVEDSRVSLRPLPALRSRDLVREAMLMAGEAVGRFALENDIPLPFTGQDRPVEEISPPTNLSESFAIRRKMKPSQQTIKPTPHAGLGMELYVQVTSPLRRYLDLVVHQQLRAFLQGDELLGDKALMERVGAAEAISGNARWAERRSLEHWTLVYLLQNPGWRGEGIIVDKRGKRDVVLIPELALETQLYQRKDLPLNSRISVEIEEVDLAFLETYFRRIS